MQQVKVLGSGCARCKQTAELIEATAREAGIAIEVEKVTELSAIMAYGVMATPGVVINDTVVHAGGLPNKAAVLSWLKPKEPSR